jgi:hypothetical protein
MAQPATEFHDLEKASTTVRVLSFLSPAIWQVFAQDSPVFAYAQLQQLSRRNENDKGTKMNSGLLPITRPAKTNELGGAEPGSNKKNRRKSASESEQARFTVCFRLQDHF